MRARHALLAILLGTLPPIALAGPPVATSPLASASAASAQLPPLASHAPSASASSPHPRVGDWSAGVDVELARRKPGCSARLLGEWLRLRCTVPSVENVALVSGEGTGFAASIIGELRNGIEVVFPLRRGDRRLVVGNTAQWGYNQVSGRATEMVISEVWLDTDPFPEVVIE